MIGSRWKTGWVVLPPTRNTPEQQSHRPHPDRSAATVCDRVIGSREILKHPPGGMRRCRRCENKVAASVRQERRRFNRDLEERQQANLARKNRGKIVDVDAYERSKAASTSVHAAGAGLPGLGRRR